MSRACGSIEQTVFAQLSKDVGARLAKYGDDCTQLERFRLDYLLSSLLKKHAAGGDEKSRIATATASWYDAERACFATNVRLENGLYEFSSYVHEVRALIGRVIGRAPDHEVLASLCKWGPGATLDVARREANPGTKATRCLTVTRRALRWLSASPYMDEHLADAMHKNGFRVVRGNRCVMVEKNAKTHRVIAAEPTGNSFLQQGVGRYFRARLKRFGVDLDDQSVNQRLASIAHAYGLSTLDLSMASDTLCSALVDLLLPPDWVIFLRDLRSPYSYFHGKWVRLEKFSSMGNAFTFELESMIFWALLQVACGPCTWVYGDDIVVRRESAETAIKCLTLFGFSVNREKSFVDGPFFESCGKHYYEGVDVTPVYQKKVVDSTFEAIRFHNRLYRWGERSGNLPLVARSMKIIQERFDLRKTPLLQPAWYEGDVGFISSAFSPIPNRKYPQLLKVVQWRNLRDAEQVGYLASKIRNPSLVSTGHPRGWPMVPRREHDAVRHRVFCIS